jgi:hypothetical protein
MATKSKPLIAIDAFPPKIKTTKNTSATEDEQFLTIDDLAAHKQKILMKKILLMVIVVNLIVLISIILCA